MQEGQEGSSVAVKSPPRFKISKKDLPKAASVLRDLNKPKRGIQLRWVVWGFQLVVVLAVIEHFLIRPHFVEPAAREPDLRGEALPVLGETAQLPQGLSEVVPSYLPVLDGLADGTLECLQRQLDDAGRRNLPVEVSNSIGMRFRLVPSGRCQIGSPTTETGHSRVEIQHEVVFLEPFYMGVFEVTQAQWEAVMGKGSNPSHFRGGNLPVEEVSWVDCMEFLRRLNELEGLPKHTYRLPSEAEWEYACRAGTATAYCFGNDASKLTDWGDYDGNNYKRTSPVGLKRCNGLGLFDMHGNVWEWCRDYYRNYPGDVTPYSSAHTYRCVRGGNWYVSDVECRSANRCRLPDRSVGNMLGFRVMRVLAAE